MCVYVIYMYHLTGQVKYVYIYIYMGLLNKPTAPLQRSKAPTAANECHRYDTKPSDVEVPVMLELRGMHITPLLPLLPDPLWPRSGRT